MPSSPSAGSTEAADGRSEEKWRNSWGSRFMTGEVTELAAKDSNIDISFFENSEIRAAGGNIPVPQRRVCSGV